MRNPTPAPIVVPATQADSAAPFAIAARDIIRRAQKAAGPMWARLSADGQLVETKAILCDEMLTDRSNSGLDWWIAVQRAVLTIILPE